LYAEKKVIYPEINKDEKHVVRSEEMRDSSRSSFSRLHKTHDI